MKISLIVGINIVRYIALPLAGVGIVKGAVHVGLIHPDPLYQFVLLLQFALPPAVAISKLFIILQHEYLMICVCVCVYIYIYFITPNG